MKLFKIENYEPVPSDECLAIEEFRELLRLTYNKQKGDHQGRLRLRGLSELRFIYFFCDYRSEFAKYPEEERKFESLVAAGLRKDHKISYELKEAMKRFTQLQESRIMKLLKSARTMVDKLTVYFNVIELTREVINEETGMTTTIPNDKVDSTKILNDMARLAKLVNGLDELEELVKKQESEGETLRGDETPGRLQ